MNFSKRLCLLGTVLGLSFGLSCQDQTSTSKATPNVAGREPAFQAVNPVGFDEQILEIAFQAVSKMPDNPHEKSRSRGQLEIVQACLSLGHTEQALRYGMQITNWRKALARANIARYFAQKNQLELAQDHLAVVRQLMSGLENDKAIQAWRLNRIRATVSQVHSILELCSSRQRKDEGVGDSVGHTASLGNVSILEGEDGFSDFLAQVNRVFETEEFSEVKHALESCVAALEASYSLQGRRDNLYRIIKTSYPRLPIPVRIRLLSDVVKIAIEHEDLAFGRDIALHISALINNGRWRPQDEVALRATFSALLHDLGQQKDSAVESNKAHGLFNEKRDAIVSIFRGQAMRPLAESFVLRGNKSRSLMIYSQALDEAIVNPNSRPRVMDLIHTCISMATHNCEWNREIKVKINDLFHSLGTPW